MDRELQVGRQKVQFDRETTVALYRDTLTVGNADHCDCSSCKNFVAQRAKAYPEVFLRLLEELGIDPLREWEAFDYDFELDTKDHLYGGWFLFYGDLVEGLDVQPEQPAPTYWFTTSFPAIAVPMLPMKEKLCAVEFLMRIPWVLPKGA